MPLNVDMHAHLLPGIDDGVENFTQAVEAVQQMMAMGYKKLIITPHIISDFYRNTPEIIFDRLDKLRDIVRQMSLDIELEAAAEYYLDEYVMDKLERQEPLLTFGKQRYLLFETSYMNASPFLDRAVFLMQSQGYKPVMAHPERYVYMFGKLEKLAELHEKGVHLQVNINSLSGYYSKPAKALAEKLIDEKMVRFLGSDCHGERHLRVMRDSRETTYYKKALKLDLLNNSL
jgi:tyrosine-protein phosphatase YwqE